MVGFGFHQGRVPAGSGVLGGGERLQTVCVHIMMSQQGSRQCLNLTHTKRWPVGFLKGLLERTTRLPHPTYLIPSTVCLSWMAKSLDLISIMQGQCIIDGGPVNQKHVATHGEQDACADCVHEQTQLSPWLEHARSVKRI